MSYENSSLEKCLEQFDWLDFTDPLGHPLKNSQAFIRLVELAERAEPWIATTFATETEHALAREAEAFDPKYSSGLFGPVFLGKFVGDQADILSFLASKKVGDICLNRERGLKRVVVVTPEMANKETERLRRIAELEKELASLKKYLFHF